MGGRKCIILHKGLGLFFVSAKVIFPSTSIRAEQVTQMLSYLLVISLKGLLMAMKAVETDTIVLGEKNNKFQRQISHQAMKLRTTKLPTSVSNRDVNLTGETQ